MHAQIVQIGNSLGVRLPKALLATLQLDRASTVSVQTRAGSIVIKPVRKPRATWAAAFAASPDNAPEDLWGGVPVGEHWGG